MNQLLRPGWHFPGGPIILHCELPAEELKAAVYTNARILLEALEESGGTPATSGKNLNRDFVKKMFERLSLKPVWRDIAQRHYKVINEQDMGALHHCRVVCECGKMIALQKKRFVVTPLGRKLLQGPAGDLYRALFLAFFDRLDLRYYCRFGDVPKLQSAFPVVLWRLTHLYTKWGKVKGIAEKVLPPGIEDRLVKTTPPILSPDWLLCAYFLKPLNEFGLLERKGGESEFGILEEDSIRLAPLFNRFIEFNYDNRVHLN